MRFPSAYYQLHDRIAAHFTNLRPTQQRSLALWVYGAIMSGSCTQSAVVAALAMRGNIETVRDELRDLLYDGRDRSAPCTTELDVTTCFVPLLRWVLTLWQGRELALAVDVTNHKDRFHVLCISVLYRGCALPVAWHILRGNTKGAWMPHICRLLTTLAPAVPQEMTVLVLSDRGLRSPTLWETICAQGWHPLMRLQGNTVFRPAGWRHRVPAVRLVTTVNTAWVGQGHAFSTHARFGTLIVLRAASATEHWIILTDLAPEAVGVTWYGLRSWIELGFRAIKSYGFHWQRTRRTDPDRAGRHWLVLAVALLAIEATGTRVDDARAATCSPIRLHRPLTWRPTLSRTRRISLFQLGLPALREQLIRGQLWRRLWLAPDPWPSTPPGFTITYHASSP